MIDIVDNAFEEAWKQGLTVVGIKFTLKEYAEFLQEIHPKYRGTSRYKGAFVIEGYKALVDGKEVKSGLLCVSIFNDWGYHYIKQYFIPFKGDNKT